MKFLHKVKSIVGLGKTLYVPDCTTKFKTPELYENYKRLLKQAKIQFIELDDHICSGDVLIDTGYPDDFDALRRKNMELFAQYHITKIITNDPEAYRTFKEFYDIEVEHISESLVKAKETIPQNTVAEDVTYHDCASLARHTFLHNQPRELLRHKGFAVKELAKNREHAQDCGAYLLDHQPVVAERCVKRLQLPSNVITASPRCYLHLKEHIPQVRELSQVL